jgi:hypothetical protein
VRSSTIFNSIMELCRSVFVGDVVMLKDPRNPETKLVRRVAALEGEEMVSTNAEDEPFKLATGTCWVLCDNESLSPKVLVWTYLPHSLPRSIRNFKGSLCFLHQKSLHLMYL